MTFYIYKMKGINYIGSCGDIKLRTQQHKTKCYKENSRAYNYLVYQYIREKQIDIELEILGVYKKECSYRIKLLVEQFYINKYNSVNNGLNTINAFRTEKNKKKYGIEWRKKNRNYLLKQKKIYYENNKKKHSQTCKIYYENNKDKIKQKTREWCINNREKQKDIELEILFCYKKECSNRIKLLVEQYYINQYDSVNNGLNSRNAFLNQKKYYKQYNKEYYKKYREDNKEKEQKRQKKYYKDNKDKIKQKSKEWCINNREKYNKSSRKSYQKNKYKRSIKINCPKCDSLIRKDSLKTHQRTQKCKKLSTLKISDKRV